MTLTRESFWIYWSIGAAPPGITDIDIPPVARNLELQGWKATGQDLNLSITAALLVKEYGGKEKLVCPTSWNDSASNGAQVLFLQCPPANAELIYPYREVPISPFRWCDVEYITIRINNIHASTSFWAAGHVRGVQIG